METLLAIQRCNVRIIHHRTPQLPFQRNHNPAQFYREQSDSTFQSYQRRTYFDCSAYRCNETNTCRFVYISVSPPSRRSPKSTVNKRYRLGSRAEAALDEEDIGERERDGQKGPIGWPDLPQNQVYAGARLYRGGEEIAFSRVGRCVVPRVKCETGIRERTSPRCVRSKRKEEEGETKVKQERGRQGRGTEVRITFRVPIEKQARMEQRIRFDWLERNHASTDFFYSLRALQFEEKKSDSRSIFPISPLTYLYIYM